MSLQVISYPKGFFLSSTTPGQGTYFGVSSEPTFTSAAHGLSVSDVVYIFGAAAQYNGYFKVNNVLDANRFRVRINTLSGGVLPAAGAGSFFFFKSANGREHGWNSVHLPIIYKLKSDIWPTNGADTARSITTFSNSNGFTYIRASGDIKTTGVASSLEKVVLSGTSVDGIYNILQWFSDTNFVIDLPYSAGNVLSSGTVQYYYFNYHARIRVYAGLPTTHIFGLTTFGIKPYQLMTEQRRVPDSNGEIIFNVSEFVKKALKPLTNNLQEGTLMNNLDSFCRLYISYAESYDDSNMYTVSEFVSAYTDDTTEVYAINAKPEFKTRGSGAMTAWVSGFQTVNQQKFLTPFVRPTLFPGNYFDISFIVNEATSGGGNFPYLMKRDGYDSNGQLLQSILYPIDRYDQGVYRFQVKQLSSFPNEARVDLTLYNGDLSTQLSETKSIDVNTTSDCHDTAALYMTWKNYLAGHDYWAFKAQKVYSIDITEDTVQDKNIFPNYPESVGEFADAITKQVSRKSRNMIKVTSQFLSKAQVDAIALIKSSPVVQIVTTTTINGIMIPSTRAVRVDANTIQKYKDRANMYTISFTITYTDEIPVQKP